MRQVVNNEMKFVARVCLSLLSNTCRLECRPARKLKSAYGGKQFTTFETIQLNLMKSATFRLLVSQLVLSICLLRPI